MFANVTGLMPGTTVDRCIDVTYTGTVDPTAVLLYANAAPDRHARAVPEPHHRHRRRHRRRLPHLHRLRLLATLYTGTLSDFATSHATYATGLSTWDPVGSPETRTFRFRLSVQDNAAAEGLTSTFGFSWETRTS